MQALTTTKAEMIIAIRNAGHWMDEKIADGNFLEHVACGKKQALSKNFVREISQATLNSSFNQSSENLYNALIQHDAFAEFLPSLYHHSFKSYVPTLVNTCTQMGFELALIDLHKKCVELASKLESREDSLDHTINDATHILKDDGMLKKAEAMQQLNSKAKNDFRVKNYYKSKVDAASIKRIKRLNALDEPDSIQKTNRLIDLSKNSLTQMQMKVEKLRTGNCSIAQAAVLIEDLYGPTKSHSIEKEIEKISARPVGGNTFMLTIVFKVFHIMRHEVCTTPEAIKFISELKDLDLKYFLTHNMSAKVLRQRLSYHFSMHPPASITSKLKVKDYMISAETLNEIVDVNWIKSHKMKSLDDRQLINEARLDSIKQLTATKIQPQDAVKRCIFCENQYYQLTMFIFQCYHCICTTCAFNMNASQCILCDNNTIQNRPKGISVVGRDDKVQVEASAPVQKKLKDQFERYQKFFSVSFDNKFTNKTEQEAEEKIQSMKEKLTGEMTGRQQAEAKARQLQQELDMLKMNINLQKMSVTSQANSQVNSQASSAQNTAASSKIRASTANVSKNNPQNINGQLNPEDDVEMAPIAKGSGAASGSLLNNINK